jgi:hypothetical protein
MKPRNSHQTKLQENVMNTLLKVKSVVLASVLVVSSLFLVVPQAEAHACTGRGTITIVYDHDDAAGRPVYYYIQNHKVCGSFTGRKVEASKPAA